MRRGDLLTRVERAHCAIADGGALVLALRLAVRAHERLCARQASAGGLVPEARGGVVVLGEIDGLDGLVELAVREQQLRAAQQRVRARHGGQLLFALGIEGCGHLPVHDVAIDGDERRAGDPQIRAPDALPGAHEVALRLGEPRALRVADRAERREPGLVARGLGEAHHLAGALELAGADASPREVAREHRAEQQVGAAIERSDRDVPRLERAHQLTAPDERSDVERRIGPPARVACEHLLGAIDVAEAEQRCTSRMVTTRSTGIPPAFCAARAREVHPCVSA